MKKTLKRQNGITLIVLVITVIVLLILAGVSIAMLTGENGIITQAIKAKENTEQAAKNEAAALNNIEGYLNEQTGESYLKNKGINSPKLVDGMRAVMFKLPKGNSKGEVIERGQDGFDENNWYNYEEKKWANARTQDGSYWVWIPRYAYKITYKNLSNKSEGGTIDIKFLVGTTDQYYDEQGNLKTAKRATSATEEIDTTKDYYVHPAFTDESKINYANGGWDKELTGIWVAKFEAGYASGNNNAPVKASSTNYTKSLSYVAEIEAGTSETVYIEPRNWLDGIYGESKTAIKYPTFQPLTYTMIYINLNDAYNISKRLTEKDNIYGLSENTANSHLMKNSEYGALEYLTHSKYGTNAEEPYLNNITLNSGNKQRTETTGRNGVDSVYSVSGVTTGEIKSKTKITTIENINKIQGNNANDGVYAWNQIEGQKASNTLNMYGVYDISGGTWERIAAYVPNENENLKRYGQDLTYDRDILKTESTKYVTVYPFDKISDNTSLEETEANRDLTSSENYKKNKYIWGDGVREVSTQGKGYTSWNNDYSYYPGLNRPFFVVSSSFDNNIYSGIHIFSRNEGYQSNGTSFRPVIVEP